MGWSLLLGLAAQAAAPLEPSGKWMVEVSSSACTLSRGFGDAAAPVSFGFKPVPTGTGGELVLVLPGIGRGVRRGAGRVVLRPSGTEFQARWVSAPIAGDAVRGVRLAVDDEAFWDALPASAGMAVDAGEAAPVALATGPMGKAFAAIGRCQDDLLRHWGADPAAMVKPTGPQLLRAVNAGSYPDAAVRAGAEGRAVALVSIDRGGKTVACRTVVSSGHESLDRATCASMTRLKLPAADEAPEKRWAVVPVRWILPIG